MPRTATTPSTASSISHAITLPYDAASLADRTRRTATILLAAGLDPTRCTLFVQSHVLAHTELTWLLNCVATFRRATADDAVQGEVEGSRNGSASGSSTIPS